MSSEFHEPHVDDIKTDEWEKARDDAIDNYRKVVYPCSDHGIDFAQGIDWARAKMQGDAIKAVEGQIDFDSNNRWIMEIASEAMAERLAKMQGGIDLLEKQKALAIKISSDFRKTMRSFWGWFKWRFFK